MARDLSAIVSGGGQRMATRQPAQSISGGGGQQQRNDAFLNMIRDYGGISQALANMGSQGVDAIDGRVSLQQPQVLPNNQGLGTVQDRRAAAEHRKASWLESGFEKLANWGEKIGGLTGWNPEEGFTAGNIARFIPSIPLQMVSGITQAPQQAAEAITGRNWKDFDENGNILDYELKGSEQLAQGANAFINGPAMLLGGSARGIGMAGDIISGGKLSAGKSRMLTGWLGDAMKTKPGRIAGQTTFDVGEESGEEFFQSFMDDTREGQLDENSLSRAVEGAKWGALGGAAFSGIGLGYQKVRGKGVFAEDGGETGADRTDMPAHPVNDVPSDFMEEMRGTGGRVRGMKQSTRDQLERAGHSISYTRNGDAFTLDRRYNASSTAKLAGVMPGQGMDEIYHGADLVESMFFGGREQDRQQLRTKFRCVDENGQSTGELEKALTQRKVGETQYETISQALNALKDLKYAPGEVMEIGAGQNPDTKNGGFRMHIAGFVDGGGIWAHHGVAPLIGMDYDGDTVQVYWDTEPINFGAIPTKMWIHPESTEGSSYWTNYDLDYLDLDTDIDESEISRRLEGIGLQEHAKWAKRLSESYGQKDSNQRKSDIIRTFADMQAEMETSLGDEWAAGRQISSVVNSLMPQMPGGARNAIANAEQAADAGEAGGVSLKPGEGAVIDDPRSMPGRGQLNGRNHPVQLYPFLGKIAYALTGNPIFRQYGTMFYNSKDHGAFMRAVGEFAELGGNVFDDLVRASFQMADSGISPADSVEGFIKAKVLSDTIWEFKKTKYKVISSRESEQAFFDIFKKHYDEGRATYNSAIKQLKERGYELGEKSPWSEMDDISDAQYAKTFLDIFGNVPVDELIDTQGISSMYVGGSGKPSLTFNQMAKMISKFSDLSSTMVPPIGDGTVSRFFKRIPAAMRSRKDTMRTSLERMVDDTSGDLIAFKNSLKHLETEPGSGKYDLSRMTEVQAAQWAALLDGYAMIIHPGLALPSGLYDINILNTRVGKALLSEDRNVRLNACACIALRAQFDPLVRDMKSDDPAVREAARFRLECMIEISDIHAIIASEMLRDTPNFNMLYEMADLDSSLGSKVMTLNRYKSARIIPEDIDFLIDALRFDAGEFSLSGETARFKKAGLAFAEFRRGLAVADKGDIEELAEISEAPGASSNDEVFNAYMEEGVLGAVAEINENIFGMQVMAAMSLGSDTTAKGTQQDAYVHSNESLAKAVNGGNTPYINEATSAITGTIDMEEFCLNRRYLIELLHDRNAWYDVVDVITGKSARVTRDSLFYDACGESYNPDRGPTRANWLALLRRNPQLAGWLCPPKPQPTYSNGSPTVVDARSTNLSTGYLDWLKAHGEISQDRDALADYYIDRQKRALSLRLMNNPNWRSYILRCVSKEIGGFGEGKFSPNYIIGKMKEMHHRALDALYWQAVHPQGGRTAEVSYLDFCNDMTSQMSNELEDIIEAAIETIMSRPIISDADLDNIATSAVMSVRKVMRFRRLGMYLNRNGIKFKDGAKTYYESGISRLNICSNAILEDLKDLTDAYVGLLHLMMSDTARQLDQVAGFRLDDNEESKLRTYLSENAVDVNGNPISNDQIDDAIKSIRKSEPKQLLMRASRPGFLFDLNDTDITFDKASRKLKKIISEIGEDKGTAFEKAESELRKCFDITGDLIDGEVSSYRKLASYWNNRVYINAFKALERLTTTRFNVNALDAHSKTLSMFDGLLKGKDSVREMIRQDTGMKTDHMSMIEERLRKDNGGAEPELPIPDFMDETTETMVNQMLLGDLSGFVPGMINMNGAMVKKISGFGWLAKNGEPESVGPEPLAEHTYNGVELLEKGLSWLSDHERWHCTIVPQGQPIRKADLRTIESVVSDIRSMPPDQRANVVVRMYDPGENAHGTWFTHCVSDNTRDETESRRLSRIFSVLTRFSQEERVLKAKKSLSTDREYIIAPANRRDGDLNSSIDYNFMSQDPEARASAFRSAKNAFKSYRSDYASAIYKVLADDTKKNMGLDENHCLMVAQALTPGVIVRMSNGKEYMIDASHFFMGDNGESFYARLDQIIGDSGGVITEMRIKTATPTECSFRILRKASAAFHDGEALDHALVREQANLGMNSWDDYEPGTLSMDTILAGFANLGYAYSGNMVSANSRTPQQFYIDETQGGVGASPDIPESKERRYDGDGIIPKNSARHSNAIKLHEQFGDFSAKVASTKEELKAYTKSQKSKIKQQAIDDANTAFVDRGTRDQTQSYYVAAFTVVDDDVSRDEQGNEAIKTLRALDPDTGEIKSFRIEEGWSRGIVVFADSPSSHISEAAKMAAVDRALKWSEETGFPVMVPSSHLPKTLRPEAICESRNLDIPSVGDSIGYTLVDGAKHARLSKRRAQPYSQREPFDRKDIKACLIDIFRLFVHGDSAGVRFSVLDQMKESVARSYRVNLSADLHAMVSDKDNRHDIEKPYRLLTAREVVSLRDSFERNPSAFIRRCQISRDAQQDGVNDYALIERLRTFFNSMDSALSANPGMTDGTLISGVGSGRIVGLVCNGSPSDSGYELLPVILPQKAPKNCDHVEVTVNGGELNVGYTAMLTFDDLMGTVKMALDGESYKTITTRYMGTDPEPEFVMNVNGQQITYPIHMAINAMTEDGRLDGVGITRMIDDMFYYSRLKDISIMHEKGPDGRKLEYRKSIRDRIKKDPGFEKDVIEGIDGSAFCNFWKAVADGSFDLIEGRSKRAARQNRLIRYIVIYCQEHRINPNDLLATMKPSEDKKSFVNPNMMPNHYMALSPVLTNRADVLDFFNALDPSICPASDDNRVAADLDTDFDYDGNFKISLNGYRVYAPVRWGFHMVIGDESGVSSPPSMASYAFQHVNARGLENGFIDEDMAHHMALADLMLGNGEYFQNQAESIAREISGDAHRAVVGNSHNIDWITAMRTSTPSELKVLSERAEIGKARDRVREVIDANGDPIDPDTDDQIQSAIERFNNTFGLNWSFARIHRLCARQSGFLYGDNGVNTVPHGAIVSTIHQLVDNFLETGLLVRNPYSFGEMPEGRYAHPLLTPNEIEAIWESQALKDHWESKRTGDNNAKQQFLKEMFAEAEKACQQVQNIQDDVAKKRRHNRAFEYDYEMHGKKAPTGYIYAGTYTSDIARADDMIARGLAGAGTGIDADTYRSLSKRQRDIMTDMFNANRGKRSMWFNRNSNGEVTVSVKTDDGKTMTAVLNNMTEVSKVMAILNPGVTAGNMVDRSLHGGIMKFAMWLGGRFHIGPYAFDDRLDQRGVKRAVNQKGFIDLWVNFREASFLGHDAEFLSVLQDPGVNISEYMSRKREQMPTSAKVYSRIYGLAQGGNKLLKTQMENFWNRFAMFCAADPQLAEIYLKPLPMADGTLGPNRIDTMLAEDGGAERLFLEIFGGKNMDSPAFLAGMQAMNFARQGDMAQQSALSMLLERAMAKSPLSRFLVTTTVMRFPRYTFSVTGRMLGWVLPMSSINYVFTERIAQWSAEKQAKYQEELAKWNALPPDKRGPHPKEYADPHYEIAQVNTGLREAILVDVTHLGLAATAAILVGMSGGIQPPDDDDKWGNPDEWIICGHRISAAWWIEDILGLSLPTILFVKSAMLGKPRVDLLMNGLRQACYNNPIVKVTDVAGFLVDPEEAFLTDYREDYEQFLKAKDGPPAVMDWLQATSTNYTLSWLMQFITPSLVKEWYNNAQTYEHSYKKIYKESDAGKLDEEGAYGETEYTTYADAMLRKATRRNPILGWLCNMVLQPETGYLAGQMPYTIYMDDYQLAGEDNWNIEGLTHEQQDAKLLQIIGILQEYDNLDDLYATGFMINGDTKAALSSAIWDTVSELDSQYNALWQDGKMDAYYLGNGDFTKGMAIQAEIKEDFKAQKDFWSDFYYKKVKPLDTSLVKYRRYNTTYATDDSGNIYATGFRPGSVLPIQSAPGTLNDPEGTAGYENDWDSVSAVTGMPIENKRALIPIDNEYEDWPDLQDWSLDGDGSSKSERYANQYGYNAAKGYGSGSGSNTSGSSPYGSKSKGGGRSYRRRRSGGGGGGGYGGSSAPNIYANYRTSNIASPRTMDRVNLDRPYLDYLRPAFETKGSRESYKREDI